MNKKTMQKIDMVIRLITVPPVMAFLLNTILALFRRDAVTDFGHYLAAVLCYTVLPLLAYPVADRVASLKKQGRKGQRKAAVWFSVAGYLLSVLILALAGGSRTEWMICLTYLVSGIAIAALSAAGFKASGHTCGVAGPVTILTVTMSLLWILGYVILIPVFLSSLRLKRHTLSQLFLGCAIPVVIVIILGLIL